MNGVVLNEHVTLSHFHTARMEKMLHLLQISNLL